MIRINLLPVREARRRAESRHQVGLLIACVVVSALLATGFHQWVRGRVSNTSAGITALQAQINNFRDQEEQVAAFKAKRVEIENKLSVIDNLEKSRSGPVHILSELSNHIPERVWLTDLVAHHGAIELKGMSLDNELVALFLTALNESPYFTEVELGATELKEVDALKLNTFTINARLQTPDDPEAPEAPPAQAAAAAGARHVAARAPARN